MKQRLPKYCVSSIVVDESARDDGTKFLGSLV